MIERRFFKTGMELRADSQGDELSIQGYGATWGTISSPLSGFRERLCPGCFARSLQSDRNISCTFNHDPSQVLGTRKAGTLSVAEDGHGLRFRAILPNTTTAKNVYELISRRDVDSCSFGFECDEDQWSEIDDPDDRSSRIALRSIVQAKIFELGPVLNPAYPATEVNALVPSGISSLDKNWSEPTPRSLVQLFPQGIPKSFSPELRARMMTHEEERSRVKDTRHRVLDFILA